MTRQSGLLLGGLFAAVTLTGCAGSGGTSSIGPSSTTDSSVTVSLNTDPPMIDTLPAAASPPAPIVVLDPGHNGGNAAAEEEIARPVPAGGFTKPCNTTGTQTEGGYPEHAFAFDIAQRAADLLRARSVTVVLTRTDDTGVGPCVDARAAIANEARASLAVSIHADGAAADVRGFHVIAPALAPDGGNAAVLQTSADAASELLAAFAASTAEPPATYPGSLVRPGLTMRQDLAGLNLARVPAVFIECANMRNAQDAALVGEPGWRQRAAEGIANGVLAHLEETLHE